MARTNGNSAAYKDTRRGIILRLSRTRSRRCRVKTWITRTVTLFTAGRGRRTMFAYMTDQSKVNVQFSLFSLFDDTFTETKPWWMTVINDLLCGTRRLATTPVDCSQSRASFAQTKDLDSPIYGSKGANRWQRIAHGIPPGQSRFDRRDKTSCNNNTNVCHYGSYVRIQTSSIYRHSSAVGYKRRRRNTLQALHRQCCGRHLRALPAWRQRDRRQRALPRGCTGTLPGGELSKPKSRQTNSNHTSEVDESCLDQE